MSGFESISGRSIAAVLTAVVLAACGASSQRGAVQSSPAPAEPRLVVSDLVDPSASNFSAAEVRLVKIDGTVIATMKGIYETSVGSDVIVLSGTTLNILDRDGNVRTLGQVPSTATKPVLVSPDLSQWLYGVSDAKYTVTIHLATAGGDRVLATLPGSDNGVYVPFSWNASGIYLVKEGIGLGGAAPFLDYRFPLAKLDIASGRVTDLALGCLVYQVLEDSTIVCREITPDGRIEFRSPSGSVKAIQISTPGGTVYGQGIYMRVLISPDETRLIAVRNGSTDPVINYQMAVAELTSSTATSFGPLDFLPDVWLPDGRVVADHACIGNVGAGACDASQNGTYIFSADGASHSLLFRLAPTASVVASI